MVGLREPEPEFCFNHSFKNSGPKYFSPFWEWSLREKHFLAHIKKKHYALARFSWKNSQAPLLRGRNGDLGAGAQERGTCDAQGTAAKVGSLGGETATGWRRIQGAGRSGRNQRAERRNTHVRRRCLPEHLPVPRPGPSPARRRFAIPPLQGTSDGSPLPPLSPRYLRTAAINGQ